MKGFDIYGTGMKYFDIQTNDNLVASKLTRWVSRTGTMNFNHEVRSLPGTTATITKVVLTLASYGNVLYLYLC